MKHERPYLNLAEPGQTPEQAHTQALRKWAYHKRWQAKRGDISLAEIERELAAMPEAERRRASWLARHILDALRQGG